MEHSELLRILDYGPETGVFTWKVAPARAVKVGSRAGSLHPSGYRIIRIRGKGYAAHRLAWFYMKAEWPRLDLDHKDENKDNNAIDNLREATDSQNKENMTKPRADNKSGYLGVHWKPSHNKWVAQICVKGKLMFLGYFDTPEQAAEAYATAKKQHHLFSRL